MLKEPFLCRPHEPDDAKFLSDVAGTKIDEAFIGACVGNQAQVREGATVVSTSAHNFLNRLGNNTNVVLASAELTAICKYLNLNQIDGYEENAKNATA
jgi:aconitate hydratase 2/2-methylisocitrate dehydratase